MSSDARIKGDSASKETVLAGLVGAGIQSSLTPTMHEREGAEQGLIYIYKKIDLKVLSLGPEALPELLTAAERLGFAGVNVTHPCKQLIIPWLHELSPDAAALGAVNTVVLNRGRRIGHNTDWWGFAESVRRELSDARRDSVVLLGAGGAGAAVAHALLTLGTRQITVIDTDRARADRLAGELCKRFGQKRALSTDDTAGAVAAADGLINATPMGMANYPGMPLASEYLRPELWVADIVYFPLETELLRAARIRGCRTICGAGMAVFQAAGAFRLFSGREANAERMLRHFWAICA
jgi:shikimate dehydrogenase